MLIRTWLVATVALLVVGAPVHFDLVTEDRLGPLVATTEVAASGEGGYPGPATDFDSLPSVNYAGLDVALLEVRVVPDNRSGRPIVVAEIAVRNTSPVQARLLLKMVQLVGPEGQLTAPDRFDYTDNRSRLAVEPGRVEGGLLVFKLRGGASPLATDYALQIGEEGRWPVTLPLDGPVPAPAYPMPLDVTVGEPIRYRGLSITLLDARSALQYGVYRAQIGQHLAVIEVSVSGPSESASALDRSAWALLDDDSGRSPIRAVPGPPPASGKGKSTVLVFAYDTEASSLTLVVGQGDDRQVVAEFKVQSFE